MAAQPQQPIYPNEFKFELDRLFTRITAYIDARVDGIATQMRVDKQESIARDEQLRQESLSRDTELRDAIKSLADAVMILTQRVSSVENLLQDVLTEVREGFAAQAERHNELMVRVERLERGNNPPQTES